MKIQGLAIVFVIIILPVYITLSTYVQVQIETVTENSKYDTMLQNATYDAVRAFQLNTVNNNFSTISDSKIRDIEASINVFFNSIATNMGETGLSRENIAPYIPMLVYTLYDGYYIYTQNPVYKTEFEASGKIKVEKEANYEMSLKPFISYSARYIQGNNDFVVNYTLDNYITIIGKVNNKNVIRSGYLINLNNYNKETCEYKNQVIKKEKLKENLAILNSQNEPYLGKYNYIYQDSQKLYKYKDEVTNEDKFFRYISYKKSITEYKDKDTNSDFEDDSALKYYNEAYEFTEWVNNNLNSITAEHCQENLEYVSNENIFDFSSGNDPELRDSAFNNHRVEIIKNSIKTNLMAGIAAYNANSGMRTMDSYEYILPKINDIQWEMITNNITVMAFMQGFPVRQFKFYNGYVVIPNDKNKEIVKDDSIYIIAQSERWS